MEKRVLFLLVSLSFLTLTCKSKTNEKRADKDSSLKTTSISGTSAEPNADSNNAPAKVNYTAAALTDEKPASTPVEKTVAKKITPTGKKPSVKKVQNGSGTYIDGSGFTIVNGQRFFPMGVYLGKGPKEGTWATSDENLQRIKSAGFNTILAYTYGKRDDAEKYMNRANALNLKVIYSLTDMYNDKGDKFKLQLSKASTVTSYVQNFKDKPNLLAWYINDELGVEQMPSVLSMYKTVRSLDDRHIVYQVNNKPDALSAYAGTADVLGTDPYAISGNDFTSLKRVSEWTNMSAQVAKNKKGVWQVVQIYDKNFWKQSIPSHTPTLNEMRNISYQSLIGGAKGLILYAYHWLFFGYDASGKKVYSEAAFNKRWPDIKRLINEMNGITPVILKNSKVQLNSIGSKDVKYQAWNYNNKLYILFANTEKKVSFINIKIPGKWTLDGKYPGVSVSLQGENLKMNCSPLTSNVLILKQ